MAYHNLLDAVKKLLPHAEAKQEALYKVTLKYPGREQAQSDYEDCRHAVSYAYEAISEATRKPIAQATTAKYTPGPWGADYYAGHVSYYSPARKDDYAFRVEFPDNLPEAEAAATAALLMAAPDSHEANLLFIGWIDSGERGFPDPDKLNEAVKAARAAIAKATG